MRANPRFSPQWRGQPWHGPCCFGLGALQAMFWTNRLSRTGEGILVLAEAAQGGTRKAYSMNTSREAGGEDEGQGQKDPSDTPGR